MGGYDTMVLAFNILFNMLNFVSINRPNCLLASYSVYHRVASQPGSQATILCQAPRSRHQRRCVRDATDCYECNYDDTMIHSRIESPSVPVPTNLESTLDRETLSPSLSHSQGMHMKVFSKVYCDRVYFCAPSGLRQGQIFTPRQYGGAPPPVHNQFVIQIIFKPFELALIPIKSKFIRKPVIHLARKSEVDCTMPLSLLKFVSEYSI